MSQDVKDGSRRQPLHTALSRARDRAVADPRVGRVARQRQAIPFVNDWKVAEARIGDLLGEPSDTLKSQKVIWLRLPPGGQARVIDWLDGRHAHEVKSGYVTYSQRILTQIAKDRELMGAREQVIACTWHFVASARSGSIGADPRILDLLDEAGISYVTHLP